MHGHNAGHENQGADEHGSGGDAEAALLVLVKLEHALLVHAGLGDGGTATGLAARGTAALGESSGVSAILHVDERREVVGRGQKLPEAG